MKRVILLLICLLVASFLFGGKFWEEKPFTEWKEKEVRKILDNSPWSKVHVTRTHSGGSFAAHDERYSRVQNPRGLGAPGGAPTIGAGTQNYDWESRRKYYVRFLSAAPVRMAIARLHMLNSNWSEEQVRQFLQTKPFGDKIAVSLFVEVPRGQNQFELDHLTTARLKDDTYLHLKKSKEKIYLEEYVPPARDEGRLEAILLFPRIEEEVLRAEKDIRFNCKLFFDHNPTAADTSRETEVKLKFKLKNMMFEGKLEL